MSHGVPIPDRVEHVYRTIPRALHALLFGPEPAAPEPVAAETEAPVARVIDIDEWLQNWRAHPDVKPDTWTVAKDRVYAAVHLRFLRWAVRSGRITDGAPLTRQHADPARGGER